MIVQIINKSTNKLPEYKTSGAVGMDISAFLSEGEIKVIKPGDTAIIPTGLFLAIPENYEIQVRSRSGLALTRGIIVLNSPGTIDSDYRGEVCVILKNLGMENFEVTNGDRIAQLIMNKIEKIDFVEVEELNVTDRNKNGFGSTGLSAELVLNDIDEESLYTSLVDGDFYTDLEEMEETIKNHEKDEDDLYYADLEEIEAKGDSER